MSRLNFGIQLPQGFFGELAGVEPTEQWDRIVGVAQRVEALGFSTLYACDHLLPAAGHAPPAFADGAVTVEGHDPIFECWTTLVGVSQHTSRIRLGQLVMAAAFRNPALVAKMVATLDVMSGGRAQLGIGAGWLDREFDAYGYPFPSPGVRIDMMSEAIDVIRALWTDDIANVSGSHWSVIDARCDPKPLQAKVPILVGAFGQRSIGVVARKGDRCNFIGTPRQYAKRLGWLQEHCLDIGRDADEIEKTWLNNGLLVRESAAELTDALEEVKRTRPISADYLELAATPEELCERLEEYTPLGVSEVIVRFVDYPSTESLELFAQRVMPEFA